MKRTLLLLIFLSMTLTLSAGATSVKHPVLQKTMWNLMTPVRWITDNVKAAINVVKPYSGFMQPVSGTTTTSATVVK